MEPAATPDLATWHLLLFPVFGSEAYLADMTSLFSVKCFSVFYKIRRIPYTTPHKAMVPTQALSFSEATMMVLSLIVLALLVTSIRNNCPKSHSFSSKDMRTSKPSKKMLIIPNLFEAWPYPTTRNRHFEAIVGYNEQLIASIPGLSPRQQKGLKALSAGHGVARAYPEASLEQLQLACDLLNPFI